MAGLLIPWVGHAAGAALAVSGLEVPAADLRLEAPAQRQAQALAHGAWGLHLQLRAEEGAAGVTAGAARFRLPSPHLCPPLPAAAPFAGRRLKPPGVGPLAPPPPPWLRHFREAVRLAPEQPELLELLVMASLRHGGRPALALELEQLAAEHPGSIGLVLELVEVLEAGGRPAEARRWLWNCARLNRWRDPALAIRLFTLLVDAGRLGEAGRVLAAARGHGRLAGHAGIVALTAEYHHHCLQSSSTWAGSRWWHRRAGVAWARKALELQAADDPAAGASAANAMILRHIFQGLGDPRRAEEALRQGIERFPADRDELELALLEFLADAGREAEAVALLTALDKRLAAEAEAWRRAGGDPAAASALVERHVELASHGVALKQPETALRILERLVQLRPRDWRLRVMVAELLLGLGEADRAAATVRPIRLEVPGKHWILSRVAALRRNHGEALRQLETAMAAARRLEQEDFFSADLHLYHSWLLDQAGRPAESLAAAERGLALAPDSPELCNTVGYLLADQNRDLPRAERLIRQALAAAPELPPYIDSLAWLLFRKGEAAAAYREVQRAIGLGGATPDPDILDHAGDIAAALGLPDAARGWWEKALAAGHAQPAKLRAKLRTVAPPAGTTTP
ncbi:MAG: tetratricopeptide repeat protein [Lentisphaeria bacterium]